MRFILSISTILLLSGSVCFAQLNNTSTSSLQKETAIQQETINKDAQETDPLKPVLDGYFSLKDALVKTDAASAAAKAQAMQIALNAVDTSKLPDALLSIWDKLYSDLNDDAAFIGGTKDISAQRDHFMNLSKNMYALIKMAKPSETLYHQFCPMANDGKGANWLSRDLAIKNPYYGSQMLTCGRTIETIKQK
jgi:hypothetical protein